MCWKNNEYSYCADLVASKGDNLVGRDPKTIATYLRLQAAAAYRDGRYEISARLGTAATCISEDARNDHAPRWDDAWKALVPAKYAPNL